MRKIFMARIEYLSESEIKNLKKQQSLKMI